MGLIKKILKAEPNPDKAKKLVAKGVELKQRGDLDGALKHYQDAQKRDPNEPIARVNEALARLDIFNRDRDKLAPDEQRAMLTDLVACLETALAFAPDDLGCHRALFFVHRRLPDFRAAEKSAQKILELASDDWPHLREVKASLESIGDKAKQQAAIEDATALASDKEADLEACKAALEALAPYLEGNLVERDALWAAGVLARRQGDPNGAKSYFKRLVKIAPKAVRAHRELADLYAKHGKAERALKHSLEAYRADPEDAALVCNVGVCYLELSDLEQAREYIDIARGLDPDGDIVRRAERALAKAEAG